MTSREKMLNAIRHALPQPADLPDISFQKNVLDLPDQFMLVLQSVGGEAQTIRVEEVAKMVRSKFPEALRIVSTVQAYSDFAEIPEPDTDPHSFANVDVAVIKAQFGVAENGAVWLTEADLGGHRVLPFITQHLIIVLEEKNIVANMHDAYTRIDLAQTGFGLFLAGPSKTADIEQSLVIGAHGARSLVVFMV
ncbi:MAG: LUD domain-containing protein [Saprospiraceae bacterium]|nr:LUD domain-containing protein [Saprospiraceae bacterium]